MSKPYMNQLVAIRIMLNSSLPSEHQRAHELLSRLKLDYNDDPDFQKDFENLIQQYPHVRDVNKKFTQDLRTTSLSVRDGLITVVSAERFQRKPRADQNIQVVVMQKIGKSLRHHVTLRSARDTLRLGEEVWGNYVCYIVDMSLRKLRIEQDFITRDHVTSVHVKADIAYKATDGELVAIGVEDALQALQDELITLLKREIVRLNLDQVSEQYLEGLIQKESTNLEGWESESKKLGLQV